MSTRKKTGQPPRDRTVKRRETQKGQSSRVSWILLGLAVAVAVAGVTWALMREAPAPGKIARPPGSEPSPRTGRGAVSREDFQPLVGKWLRPDGGYVISVRSVDPDGRVDADYYNPRPINVSRAEASREGETIRLFIELQAPGYPGSTYNLLYKPSDDVLAGVYFQAAMQQRFEVVFVRTQ